MPDSKQVSAIIIGASRYLQWPERENEAFLNSAKGFRDYLCANSGLNLSGRNILDLFNNPGEVVRQDILIEDFLKRQSSSNWLLLFYCGHGGCLTSKASGENILFLSSTRKNRIELTGYALPVLKNTIARNFSEKNILLFFDCYPTEGLSISHVSCEEQTINHLGQKFGVRMASLFAASKPGPVLAHHKDKYTLFSKCLLDVMNNGDLSTDKQPLTLHRISEKVKTEIQKTYPDNSVELNLLPMCQNNSNVAFIPFFPNSGFINQKYRKKLEEFENSGSTILDLSHCDLRSFPKEITKIKKIRVLNLQGNQISSLPPEIKNMKNLTAINLNGNKLTSLPRQLANLPELTEIKVADNALSKIPRKIFLAKDLNYLDLKGNPIQPKGVEGGKDLLDYFRKSEKIQNPNGFARMVVIGDPSVGKTSLIKKLQGKELPPNASELPTRIYSIEKLIRVSPATENGYLNIRAWDFGKDQIFIPFQNSFLSPHSLYVLVWNVTWANRLGRLTFWLGLIKTFLPEVPVLVVATHKSSRMEENIEEIIPTAKLMKDFPQIRAFCWVDNVKDTGIRKLKEIIIDLVSTQKKLIPWWPEEFLDAVDEFRNSEEQFISLHQALHMISRENIPEKSAMAILKSLHHWGEILFLPESNKLRNVILLKPQWALKRINNLLNSEYFKNQLSKSKGILKNDVIDDHWEDLNTIQKDHILDLMEHFNILYRTDQPGTVGYVPEYIPVNSKPYIRKWDKLRKSQTLAIKFEFSNLFPEMIYMFLASTHKYSRLAYWKSGAVLTGPDNSAALFQAFPEKNYLTLDIYGTKAAIFLQMLWGLLDDIAGRFPKTVMKIKIPCLKHDKIPCDYEYDLEQLNKKNPNEFVFCYRSGEDVLISELITPYYLKIGSNYLKRSDLTHLSQDHIKKSAGILGES